MFGGSSQATMVAFAAAGMLRHKLVHIWAPSKSAAEVFYWPLIMSIWAVYHITNHGLCAERSSVHCSGHCIIYVMAPLVFHTYYPGWTAAFLWLAVIRTCFRVSLHKCFGLLLCVLACLPACLPVLYLFVCQ